MMDAKEKALRRISSGEYLTFDFKRSKNQAKEEEEVEDSYEKEKAFRSRYRW